MHVRVIDYVANPGGVSRVVAETLRGFHRLGADITFEIVTYGMAAESYSALLRSENLDIPIRPVRPEHCWNNLPPHRVFGIRGSGRLMRIVRSGKKWEWEIRAAAFEDCDAVWLPFLSRHRVPALSAHKAVATCQDVLTLDFPGMLSDRERSIEEDLTRSILSSSARIVVSSAATRDALTRLFAADSRRVSVIPFSVEHTSRSRATGDRNVAGELPYLLYAAYPGVHKNHETLIRGFARWSDRDRFRLVLTGRYTDLANSPTPRSRILAELVEREGLRLRIDVLGLGHVPTSLCDSLLSGAWAVVVPTLYEGFGLPVGEAVAAGVPVIASSIPVLREQVEAMGAEILWFDPREPGSLTSRLRELSSNYPRLKSRAAEQARRLKRRTWADVAAEYYREFDAAASHEPRRVLTTRVQ